MPKLLKDSTAAWLQRQMARPSPPAPTRRDRGPRDLATAGAGFPVRGDKHLYMAPFLREYDGAELIAPGDETGGEGRTLHPTWDVPRFHDYEE